jgi:tRNA(Ile)-lysidine synthetase-like protein
MSKKGSVADNAPVAESELPALFDDFANSRRTLLAVSGGPDSTALLVLAARWRAKRANGPDLIAATIDHKLRAAAKAEAKAVAKLAGKLGIPHRILEWKGRKPATGVQEAAREARFAMFSALAKEIGADTLMTAHTRDDQAETVLHRMGRGSGIGGLAGIRRVHQRGEFFWRGRFSICQRRGLLRRSRSCAFPLRAIPPTRIRNTCARGCESSRRCWPGKESPREISR